MKTIMAFLVVSLGAGIGAGTAQADEEGAAFRTLGVTASDGRVALRLAPGYWDDDDDGRRRGWYLADDDRWDDDDGDDRWDDDDDDDRWDDDD